MSESSVQLIGSLKGLILDGSLGSDGSISRYVFVELMVEGGSYSQEEGEKVEVILIFNHSLESWILFYSEWQTQTQMIFTAIFMEMRSN